MDGNSFRELLTKLPSYTAINACISLGVQTGLFNTLCQRDEPISVEDLAVQCRLKERILVEWIEILVTDNVLSMEKETKRYFLRDEIKEVFRDKANAMMFLLCDLAVTFGARQKKFVEFFKQDGPSGLPISETPEAFDVLEADPVASYRSIFENNLFNRVDGLREKLESGVEFADVGCGGGGLTRVLAQRFPKGRYIGIDCIDSLTACANKELAASGLSNCMFEVQNAEQMPEEWSDRFDVVFMHSVFHDLSHPKEAAREFFRVVKENGVVLIVDLNLKSDSEYARTQSATFTALNMYYCLPGDMGAHGAIPIGCVRTGDTMEKILKAIFPTVVVSRASDTCIVHICSK